MKKLIVLISIFLFALVPFISAEDGHIVGHFEEGDGLDDLEETFTYPNVPCTRDVLITTIGGCMYKGIYDLQMPDHPMYVKTVPADTTLERESYPIYEYYMDQAVEFPFMRERICEPRGAGTTGPRPIVFDPICLEAKERCERDIYSFGRTVRQELCDAEACGGEFCTNRPSTYNSFTEKIRERGWQSFAEDSIACRSHGPLSPLIYCEDIAFEGRTNTFTCADPDSDLLPECIVAPVELANTEFLGCDPQNFQETCPPIQGCGLIGTISSIVRATGCQIIDDKSYCKYKTDVCYNDAFAQGATPCNDRNECRDETGAFLAACDDETINAGICVPNQRAPQGYSGFCQADWRICSSSPGTVVGGTGGTGTTTRPTPATPELGTACKGIGNFNINNYRNIRLSAPDRVGKFDADSSDSMSYKANIAGIYVNEDSKDIWQDDCPAGENGKSLREWTNILEFYNLAKSWSSTDTDYMNAVIENENYPQTSPEYSCFNDFMASIKSQCAGSCETPGDLPNPAKNYNPGCSAYCLTESNDGFGINAKTMSYEDLRLGFTFTCPGSSVCLGTLIGKDYVTGQTDSSTVRVPTGYTQHYNIGQGDVTSGIPAGSALFSAICADQSQRGVGIEIGPGSVNPPQQLFCCTSKSLECSDKSRCPEGYIYDPQTQKCKQLIPTGQAVGGKNGNSESCEITGLKNTPEFKERAAQELADAFRDLSKVSPNELTDIFKNNLRIEFNKFFIEYIPSPVIGKTTDKDATERVYNALKNAVRQTTPNPWPAYTYCAATIINGGIMWCVLSEKFSLTVPQIGRFTGQVPELATSPATYTAQVPEKLELNVVCSETGYTLEIEGDSDKTYTVVSKQKGKRENKGAVKTNTDGIANLEITNVDAGALLIVETEYTTAPDCKKEQTSTTGTDAKIPTNRRPSNDRTPDTDKDTQPGTPIGFACSNPEGCRSACTDGDCDVQIACSGNDCDGARVQCTDCDILTCQGSGCGTCTGNQCSLTGAGIDTGTDHRVTASCTNECRLTANQPYTITTPAPQTQTAASLGSLQRISRTASSCQGPFCYSLKQTLEGLTSCSLLTRICTTIESKGTNNEQIDREKTGISASEIIAGIKSNQPMNFGQISPNSVSIVRKPNNDVSVTVRGLVPDTPISVTTSQGTTIGTTTQQGTFYTELGKLPAGTEVVIVAMPVPSDQLSLQASDSSQSDAGSGSFASGTSDSRLGASLG